MIENENTKPKWLQALEQQSWQAELVVSGIAIYGALLLPDLLYDFIDYSIFNFSDDILVFIKYVDIYLMIGISVLIVGLLIHFISRSLWIGLVGLSSVYPDGIKEDNDNFSKIFSKELVAKFNNLTAFNKQLDDYCSLILSSTFVFVIGQFIVTVWIFVFIALWMLLNQLFGQSIANLVIFIGSQVFVAFAVFVSLLNIKFIKNQKWIQRNHFKIHQFFSEFFLVFFNKAYSYVYYTIITNVKTNKKNVFSYSLLFLIVIVIIMLNSNFRLLEKRNFHRYNNSSIQIDSENYQTNSSEKFTICPSIQSEIISGDFLRLQLPKLERESKSIQVFVNDCEEDKNLTSVENKARCTLQNLNHYYSLSIDTFKLQDLKFNYFKGHNDQDFFLTIIPLDSIPIGNHILKIEREYKNDDGENAIQFITFWKE